MEAPPGSQDLTDDEIAFQIPAIRNADLNPKRGDFISFVTGAGREAFRHWGVVVDFLHPDAEERQMLLIALSPGPCSQPIRRGALVRLKESEVWAWHPPGAFDHYVKHVQTANINARAASHRGEEPAVKPCLLPFAPCFMCEPRMNLDYRCARGCWTCGETVRGGYKCEQCNRARYCNKKCAIDDTGVHMYPCSFWQSKRGD